MQEVSKSVSLNANGQVSMEVHDFENDNFVNVEMDRKHDSKGVEPKKKENKGVDASSKDQDTFEDNLSEDDKLPGLNLGSTDSSDEESDNEDLVNFEDH